MSKFKDLTGERFDKLLVIERAENQRRNAMWLCQCDCGNFSTVRTSSLNSGQTRSCGCRRSEMYKKKYNEYKIHGDIVVGIDSNAKVFIFDADDYDQVKKHTWLVDALGYASTTIYDPNGNKTLQLHRLIMDKADGMVVDHINRNPKDNRKENLRHAKYMQNSANRNIAKNNISGVAGVSKRNDNGKWQANITINYKRKYLGQFDDKEDAIKVRKQAEKKYFGEFMPSEKDNNCIAQELIYKYEGE